MVSAAVHYRGGIVFVCSLFIVAPIVVFFLRYVHFCYAGLCVPLSFAIISLRKREQSSRL